MDRLIRLFGAFGAFGVDFKRHAIGYRCPLTNTIGCRHQASTGVQALSEGAIGRRCRLLYSFNGVFGVFGMDGRHATGYRCPRSNMIDSSARSAHTIRYRCLSPFGSNHLDRLMVGVRGAAGSSTHGPSIPQARFCLALSIVFTDCFGSVYSICFLKASFLRPSCCFIPTPLVVYITKCPCSTHYYRLLFKHISTSACRY